MKGHNLISALVIGASLIVAALAFGLVGALLRNADDAPTELALERHERQLEAADARIAELEQAIEELRRQHDALAERLAAVPTAPVPAPPVPALPSDQFGGAAPSEDEGALVDPMLLAKGEFNQGIERPTPALMRELIGEPRSSYSDQCESVTNPRLIAALETRQVEGFRAKVTMLKPALDSLAEILERLRREDPAIYSALGTAGALCVRHVRGAPGTVSSHAWGAAIDLTLTGDLDAMGDDATQNGLIPLAEHFNDAGWYWGAGYGREDSMHFEVGGALLRQWAAEGRM
jgi:hypothetical protein